ncbi:MAG: undecaprenyl/decaprenyl-phosphate alpha-N-acetylglucosaminyl 1-phosphate transferase [Chloroflexi bacterium]|nr:undecaprenyl/decaprenyl-phosphate alpha-N-acetylglucosaminyl 1-phosphate transferase [Chloroflexota bacterium]
MIRYLLILGTALLLAMAGTPLARRVALRLGMLAQPGAQKLHQKATPLLGGLAIYGASLMALVLVGDRFYIPQAVSIFLGATLVSFMGLWDDRWPLSPWAKLAGQLMGALLLAASGVQVSVFRIPAINVAVTLLWVVGITNAINLLDNMDGLSGGVAVVASAFFLVLAAMNGQYLVGMMTAALVGACAGFLVYNFNPARIFMGDSGSLFLGFLLAAVGIKLRFPANADVITWMVPVLVLGLPIFDTTLVFVSRLRRGVNPLTHGGKDHLSHRLVGLGYTQKEAVLICYLATGACGLVAMFVTSATLVEAYAVAAAVAGVGVAALWRLEWGRPTQSLGQGG